MSATSDVHLAALKELVQSDGWKLFADYIDSAWGSTACLEKIDSALKDVDRGDDNAERSTVAQIRVAARQIQALKEWPKLRIAQLTQSEKTRRPFEALRRYAR